MSTTVRRLSGKLVGMMAALLLMTLLVFILQSIIPSDPARAMAGPAAPPETLERVREKLGLDDPIYLRYGRFLQGLLQGELGTSIRTRNAVTSDISRHGPASLELACVALAIALGMAALLAGLQAIFPSFSLARLFLIAAGSAPVFLTATVLVYLLWFQLDLLPAWGRIDPDLNVDQSGFVLGRALLLGDFATLTNAARHVALPALVLAFPIAVAVSQSLTAALQDVMRQEYVRAALGNGLSTTRVVLFHALRNAASAPIAMTGLQIRLLFGNLLIVERVFGWPGLGFYVSQALSYSDLPAILGVAVVLGAFYLVVSAVVEVVQVAVDPRRLHPTR